MSSPNPGKSRCHWRRALAIALLGSLSAGCAPSPGDAKLQLEMKFLGMASIKTFEQVSGGPASQVPLTGGWIYPVKFRARIQIDKDVMKYWDRFKLLHKQGKDEEASSNLKIHEGTASVLREIMDITISPVDWDDLEKLGGQEMDIAGTMFFVRNSRLSSWTPVPLIRATGP